jgi:predicted ATPase/DNA-binding CsgD family transcriptional regulator
MFDSLTEREQEILLLLSRGMTNKEIATQLYLSSGTVKAHNHNIFSKLGVSSRTQALLRAQELGLLEPDGASGDHAQDTKGAGPVTNLSPQFTPFFGRKSELDKLADLLGDARVRLITISGAGGTGKTRLAIETARQQMARFPDGVFFVSLARVSEFHNISSAIIDDMGLRYQASDSLDQQLFAYLRNKQVLLVLDNFEHLLEGVDFITELLQASPSVRLLVTSRERLNLSAEVLFVLGGLDYNASPDATDPSTGGAVQLLIQRALSINPNFELHPNDWPHVRRICQLTNGMPLALILAAGWSEMLTFEEIAGELTHSIDILESQLHDLPARQRSMRATIASSWGRFTAEEQQVFASLSVFRGGFTREAAGQVAGADLRELQTLVNRSFIIANTGRYEIHELLRQYGWEQLQHANRAADVRTAHSDYYLDFLRQRDDDLKGHRQRAVMDEIHADFENIRAAWLWAVEQRNYDALSQAADCLCNFAEMRALLVRVEDILWRTVTALAPAVGETPHPVCDQMVVRHLQMKHRLSLPVELALLDPILQRARARADHYEVAYGLWVLGNQALRDRDYTAHQAAMQESLSIWRQLGDEFYVAHALVGSCGEDMTPETSEWAIQYLQESAAIRRRLGDLHDLSFSLMLIGIRLMYQGAFEEAHGYFDRCLTLQDEYAPTPDFAGIVSLKGLLAFWQGDFEAAAHYAQAGIDFSQEMNYYGDRSACQALLGCVFSIEGDYARAYELCQQATRDELFDVSAVSVQWGLALACCALDEDAARQPLLNCLHIARDNLHSPVFQQVCLPLAAVLSARTGERERAVELLALALNQPPAITGWIEKWPLLTDIHYDLKNQLDTDTFSIAWERGLALQLEDVIAHLLDGDVAINDLPLENNP